MGQFASGVTVVTGRGVDGRPVGATISAFSSLSLDPPLVLFCLDRGATCLPAFTQGPAFIVNVLASDQADISNTFAGPAEDRFATVAHGSGANGCPRLNGCLATVECAREAVHDGGDHVIILGRVTALDVHDDRDPLVYFRGAYALLG